MIRVQTHLAPRAVSTQLHVFESEVFIPRFASFKLLDLTSKNNGNSNVINGEPNSQVVLRINESVDRLIDWVSSGFIIENVEVLHKV